MRKSWRGFEENKKALPFNAGCTPGSLVAVRSRGAGYESDSRNSAYGSLACAPCVDLQSHATTHPREGFVGNQCAQNALNSSGSTTDEL